MELDMVWVSVILWAKGLALEPLIGLEKAFGSHMSLEPMGVRNTHAWEACVACLQPPLPFCNEGES